MSNRSLLEDVRSPLLGVAGFLLFLVVWELLQFAGPDTAKHFSFPLRIVGAVDEVVHLPAFGAAVWKSSYQFVAGILIGSGAGILLALLLGFYRPVGQIFRPLMVAGYTLPLIALIPVLVLILGIGSATAITVVALFTFFPVFFVIYSAMVAVDPALIRMCRSFGGGDRQLIVDIVLPSLVPAVISGIRLGVGRGLAGLVVTELYLGSGGVGGFMLDALGTGAVDQAFVAILVFGVANLALTGLLRHLEKRVEIWRPR